MASSYSVLALDTVGRLDREVAAVRGYVDDLAEVICGDVRTAFLQRSLAVVVTTLQQLRQRILDLADDTGSVSLDELELALRARMNIVIRAVYTLQRYEHDVPRAAFVGRFDSTPSVGLYLAAQVARIHARWLEQRRAHDRLDSSTQRSLAYTMLYELEVTFEKLGREIDLVHFLRAASTSRSQAVRTACREIAATVAVATAFADDPSTGVQAHDTDEGHR